MRRKQTSLSEKCKHGNDRHRTPSLLKAYLFAEINGALLAPKLRSKEQPEQAKGNAEARGQHGGEQKVKQDHPRAAPQKQIPCCKGTSRVCLRALSKGSAKQLGAQLQLPLPLQPAPALLN